jgi:superoxide dismutase, Cu-Zn family
MAKVLTCLVLGWLLAVSPAAAQSLNVEIYAAESTGVGASIGTIAVTTTPYGTVFTPNLSGLSPGVHGFHVHENPSCNPMEKDGKMVAAQAAGGHYDPGKTGKHLGPYAEGHLGDLPPLFVDTSGKATIPVLAPRIKLSDLKGRSLMVHMGGDNFSDHPEPLGGGGGRIGCGVVK